MKIGEFVDPRKLFGKTVSEAAEENKKVVVMSADSGKSSGFGDFAKNHPDRYFECGIMEQGVVGFAAGLATTGKIPVFCAIAPFVTCRPYEMVRNDVGYMQQNVKLVGRNCGLTYSDLGSTHHSLEDFAIMRMIPGMTIIAPQDPTDIAGASKAMLEHVGPVYMRIGNPKIPVLFEEKPFVIGKGSIIEDGSDVTIIATGSMTRYVLDALPKLKSQGISARVVGMPTVWPIDRDLVVKCAKETGRIVTVEEHYTIGGLGTIVGEVLLEEQPVPLKKLGVPYIYASNGPYEPLLAKYGLQPDEIAASVQEFCK